MGTSPLEGPVTVAVIDDQELALDGVKSWISSDRERRAVIIATGQTVESVLDGPGRDAAVLVLDLDLGRDWKLAKFTEATRVITRLCDDGHRVVVFSVHTEPLVIQAVIDSGARAFIDKHTERNLFVDTVVAVGRDQPVITPSMAGGLLHQPRPEVRLADREKEALRYLFQGMDYESISLRMVKDSGGTITKATVREYIDRARAKFAAAGRPTKSNLALLARCIELGLITPADVEEYRSRAAAD